MRFGQFAWQVEPRSESGKTKLAALIAWGHNKGRGKAKVG